MAVPEAAGDPVVALVVAPVAAPFAEASVPEVPVADPEVELPEAAGVAFVADPEVEPVEAA